MALAKKSLGQNFLMHAQTAERIVGAARLPEGALVLEVGPGTGMLTRALLSNEYRVVAVEADDALAPELRETFSQEIAGGRLEIVHEDIRSFDTARISEPYHVVANIPYYITGEIIRQFLEAEHKPDTMTPLVQKEVAERIARNGGKGSILSVSVEAYGSPEYCFTVPRGAFRPAPTVDSAVLSIRAISSEAFPSRPAESWFFQVLRAGFAHKRKKLAKNLEILATAERIRETFATLGLDSNIRPEDVSTSIWKELAQGLEKMGK
jgi:16S rRNA (adenine1518-N6/adenine1519-N6)-dimethyltransferase